MRFVDNSKNKGTGAPASQVKVTDAIQELNESEADQFEVESEGQTRAKIDDIFN